MGRCEGVVDIRDAVNGVVDDLERVGSAQALAVGVPDCEEVSAGRAV